MLDVRRWTFALRAAKETEGFQRTGKRGGGFDHAGTLAPVRMYRALPMATRFCG